MMQPEALGGYELDPAELISIVERLSHADGSTGWIGSIGAGGPAFTAWLDPAVARDVLSPNGEGSIATVFAPTGQLRPGDGGVHDLSGRWPFASGCRHATWFFTGAFVFDDGAPRMTESGPDWRLALFPSDQGQIIDNWDVLGMRATGSNDIEARDVRVLDEMLIRPFFEPARHDGPLWRLSFFTLAGIALVGVPLGIARRALAELTRSRRQRCAPARSPLSPTTATCRSSSLAPRGVCDQPGRWCSTCWMNCGRPPTTETHRLSSSGRRSTSPPTRRCARRSRRSTRPSASRGHQLCVPPDPALLP